MSSRKKSQRSICILRKFFRNFGYILPIVLCFFPISIAVNRMLVYRNCTHGDLMEYTGGYSYSVSRHARNTVITFVLENGDLLSTAPEFLENREIIDEFSQLRFVYAAPSLGIPATYTPINITTVDSSICFLEPSKSIEEVRGYMVVCSMIGILPLLLYLAPVIYFNVLIRKTPCNRKKS